MLPREVMGVFALGVLWVNTLLIAAVAVKSAVALVTRWRALGPIVDGVIARGDGSSGAFARQRVEQVGRAKDDGAVVFHARRVEAEVFGGVISSPDGSRVVEGGELWLSAARIEREAAKHELDEATRVTARRARGVARTLEIALQPGDRVFVGGGIVSDVDPRAVLGRRALLGFGFAMTVIAAALGCTRLAFSEPLFGTTSTAGGALGLLFFLLVQPAGTKVRDRMRLPSATPVAARA